MIFLDSTSFKQSGSIASTIRPLNCAASKSSGVSTFATGSVRPISSSILCGSSIGLKPFANSGANIGQSSGLECLRLKSRICRVASSRYQPCGSRPAITLSYASRSNGAAFVTFKGRRPRHLVVFGDRTNVFGPGVLGMHFSARRALWALRLLGRSRRSWQLRLSRRLSRPRVASDLRRGAHISESSRPANVRARQAK